MYQRYPEDITDDISTGGVCIAPLTSGKYMEGFVSAKRFIPQKFEKANVTMTVNAFTGLYAGIKCNGDENNAKLATLRSGDEVTVLYTLTRGDGKGISYVTFGDMTGFIMSDKLS